MHVNKVDIWKPFRLRRQRDFFHESCLVANITESLFIFELKAADKHSKHKLRTTSELSEGHKLRVRRRNRFSSINLGRYPVEKSPLATVGKSLVLVRKSIARHYVDTQRVQTTTTSIEPFRITPLFCVSGATLMQYRFRQPSTARLLISITRILCE